MLGEPFRLDHPDRDASFAVLGALEAGRTLVDTADSYSG
jgi:hypothetical protein